MVDFVRKVLPGALGEIAELAYTIPAYWRLRRACRAFKPDFIYERCNLYYLAGTWLARATGLPFLLEVNAPLADERIRFGGLRLHGLAHRLENAVWRAADRVLPVTAYGTYPVPDPAEDEKTIDLRVDGIVKKAARKVAEGKILAAA